MTLDAQIDASVGDFRIVVSIKVKPGETVAVLGPNGAGKTSLLRILAGLHPVDRGRMVLDDQVLEDKARSIRVPCERRPIGMVFQEYLLFPHLSVVENVAFGLRSRGSSQATARLCRPMA